MNGAIGDCTVTPADAPGAFVQLNSLVNGESQNFWPILAGFGQGVTQVDAAVSTHAQIATVWLGSNDLLKVALSQGAAPVTAPQSVHDDIVAIVRKLQGAGSKVAVANLVDVHERLDVHPAACVRADAAGIHHRAARGARRAGPPSDGRRHGVRRRVRRAGDARRRASVRRATSRSTRCSRRCKRPRRRFRPANRRSRR